jgi:hypothetical protein
MHPAAAPPGWLPRPDVAFLDLVSDLSGALDPFAVWGDPRRDGGSFLLGALLLNAGPSTDGLPLSSASRSEHEASGAGSVGPVPALDYRAA